MDILLVEDDAGDASLIRRALLASGMVTSAGLIWERDLAGATKAIRRGGADAILLDLTLPDSAGIQTVRAMREAAPRSAILVLTGHDDMATALQTLEAGAQDYIFKGDVDSRSLVRAIRYARERQSLEQQLARSRERYRMFAEAGSDWLWETDAEHRFTYFSDAFAAITGFVPEALLGKRRVDLFSHEIDTGAVEAHLATLTRHEPFKNFEYPLRDTSGSVRYIRASGVPVFEGSRFVGYRGVAADITRVKALGRRLDDRMADLVRSRDQLADQTAELAAMMEEAAVLKDRAEEEARAKTDFLSTMSHEIRTPMTAVLGIVEVLRAEPLSARQHALVETIHEAGHTLVAILDDVLDVSKLQAGRLDLVPEPADPLAVAERAGQLFTSRAEEHGNRITIQATPAVPARVRMDGHRLGQILFNLIGNAVKFTQDGRITVSLDAHPAPDAAAGAHGLCLDVAVCDTGVGIEADRLPALFSRFQQGDAATARIFGGSGLGLALCKALVERMGGTIGVESTPGVGSRFFFSIPVEPLPASVAVGGAPPPQAGFEAGTEAATAIQGTTDATAVPGVRLLVAEDNRLNQVLLREVLSTLGQVTMVGDGQEALEAHATGAFHLVVMDIRMPVLSGLDAIRAIRARPDGARVPIIALSADVMPEQQAEQREAGADISLGKPLDIPALLAAARALLKPAASPPPAADASVSDRSSS